ncbi:conserved Plasmodium protein, unknown function [Plasmodium gallinaceum]|uniref:Uncharacterized protein n=1 Tax=Plasmodium gallinaceum TaxID=5849 RepID=A0A1J1GQ70_PLAGA|nr:conserved Plasmodium protein, unknown function [Plasmodium gallinaceum]CRG94587.1 conserved Plasmodium protein, unknown function [Plasmodium gallinaceum]
MNLDWKENFEEIEITIRKEKNNRDDLLNFFHDDFFFENYYSLKLDNVKDILITEVYIRIVDKNNTFNIDLYDKISIHKEDIKIKKHEDFLILKLKKKEKKLWGHLHFFSLFIHYKNKFYPNLLKCTKEEKNKLYDKEKKFKTLINMRRIKSLEELKKMIKKQKTHNEEFCRKLEDDAQKMQWKSEELKNEQLKILKENVKKKAIDSIYEVNEHYDISEADQNNNINEVDQNNQVDETNKNMNETNNNSVLIGYNNNNIIKKNNILLNSRNVKNRVIELKFTELKKSEIPARETRNLKKTLSNYSSTKNFFLIILIEKAKKMFFKNSDFSSCLEILNSITTYISTGYELNREELIKVLNNLSLLYLLTNNLNKCIEECDKCLNIINEELKNYSNEEINIQNTFCENHFPKTLNFLEEIKSQNYVEYLYIIYSIVIVRKIYAMIKKNDLKGIEENFICIEKVQNFLPKCFYESIKKDVHNLKVFNIIIPLLESHSSSSKEIKENLYKLNNQISEVTYDFSLNFYFVLKRSFYLKNLNFFYKNIINILLCFFHIIDKHNKMYSLLNNIEQFSLTKFLLNIYEFVLLLKNNSSFMEKIIEIEKLNKVTENSFIQEKIIDVLTNYLIQDHDNEFEFFQKHNYTLKRIIILLCHSNNDEERDKLEKEKKEKNKNVRKNISVINLSFSDIFYNNLYKLKKNNKIVKDINCSNFSKSELKIELFVNEDYYKNLKDRCELLKIELSLEIIKFICYTFNLMQRIYKDNMEEKKIIRNVIFNLLIDLSYCISNLNSSYLKIENIVSVIFLYFCFSFIYNFENNEFLIDTQLKSESKIHFHILTLNDVETNRKISKDTIKNIITKTFLNNFYAEYKNFIDLKKKKDEYMKNSQYNIMLNKTCYLIKKIKSNNKNLEIALINNKYVEEIFNFLICLNKENYYLKSIQYSILLLSHDLKYSNVSKFNLNYIYIIKKIFNMSFFIKNKTYENQTIKNNTTILNQEKLRKILSYFTDSSIKFKNTKRVNFTRSLTNGNVENNLVCYLETIIKKYKKIKIFRNINFCLKQINANRTIIINIQNIIIKYLDNLLIDFHLLNCVLQFNRLNLSSYFFINKNIIEFNDLNSKVISTNCKNVFNNKLEIKNIVNYYFIKYLKVKIIILNNKYYL